MRLSRRERYILVVMLLAAVALALDRYLLTPYFDRLDKLAAEKGALLAELERARVLFSRSKQLSTRWQEMLKAGLKTDPAAAESSVLNALQNWAQQSGLALSSLKPEQSTQRRELREIAFQLVGVGSMSGVSGFLWQVESAALPVKVDEIQLAARKEGADDLTLQVRVSALCMASPTAASSQAAPSGTPPAKEAER